VDDRAMAQAARADVVRNLASNGDFICISFVHLGRKCIPCRFSDHFD
jgi:hypothetical protein